METLLRKLEVVKDNIPEKLYNDLKNSEDQIVFEKFLTKHMMENTLTLDVDWLYSCLDKNTYQVTWNQPSRPKRD